MSPLPTTVSSSSPQRRLPSSFTPPQSHSFPKLHLFHARAQIPPLQHWRAAAVPLDNPHGEKRETRMSLAHKRRPGGDVDEERVC
ncbi:hypothetical protein E2C01_071053 [Portunus trituberculatus]|uniref:Uncharacterized protein n=1 Tax=Portunus trituberculatus TaxID=210409 RepID=A0A5B7I3U6_PORTR|nr:hypothetical protein [Portunus trituberculatus]